MRGFRLTVFAFLFAGCASASPPNPAGDVQPDADPEPGPGADAALPDAPPVEIPDAAPPAPVMVTLSQTTNATIAMPNTVNCHNAYETAENSYYRVFPLADYGITNAFHVQNVQFAVEESDGAHTVSVNVGTYAGAIAPNTAALDPGQWTPIASAQQAVPDGAGGTVTVPIDTIIPAGSKLMVELLSPGAGDWFFPGSNANGETYPTFTRSQCSPTIHSYVSDGFGGVHVILTVTGTH